MAADKEQEEKLKQLKKAARTLRLSMPTKEKKMGDRTVNFFSGGRLVDYILKEMSNDYSTRQEACELAAQLLRSRFFVRAEFGERKVKTKDGEVKTKKKLQPVSDRALQLEFVDDPKTPYVWLYTAYSVKQYVISVLVLLGVGTLTTMPVWPHAIRSVVHGVAWYTGMSLLLLITSIFLVRYLVNLIVYYGSARAYDFWILPNINDEELGVLESFKPLYSLDTVGEGEEEEGDEGDNDDAASAGDSVQAKGGKDSPLSGAGSSDHAEGDSCRVKEQAPVREKDKDV